MTPLASVAVKLLVRAAIKLAFSKPGREAINSVANGVDRALWQAAKNYRADLDGLIKLPKSIVDRVNELLKPDSEESQEKSDGTQ